MSLTPPLPNPTITQPFGANPTAYARFNLPGHEGLDFACSELDPVVPIAPGQVYHVEHNPNRHPYGLHVRIQHAATPQISAPFKSIYAHLSRILVTPGQHVTPATILGYPGSTGNSTGTHLHLTLKIEGHQTPGYPAEIVDPAPFLFPAAAAPAAPPAAPPSPIAHAAVTAHTLYIRRQPSTAAPIIGELHAGIIIPVFSLSGPQVWAQIAPGQFIALQYNGSTLAEIIQPQQQVTQI